jgi:hypothetical protein
MRVTQGVKLIELDPDEKLVGLARAEKETEEKDGDIFPEDLPEEAPDELVDDIPDF